MALDALTKITEKPSLAEALISFGADLNEAENLCQDVASARYLVGTALINLALDLESAFEGVDTTPLPINDEAPFLDTEAANFTPTDSRQIPVMAKPMLALVPTLNEEAKKLLNGSNRVANFNDIHFRLLEHKANFNASAAVIESIITSIKPIREARFEQVSTTKTNAAYFAKAVAARLDQDRSHLAAQFADGPDQALIASTLKAAYRKAA